MKTFVSSLQFRIQTVFILSFLLVLLAIFVVFSTVGRDLLEKQSQQQAIMSGHTIVSNLANRLAMAESLAVSMASIGETLPHQDERHREVVRHVLNHEGSESFIAGGGLWPEPFAYDKAIERRSFFWGRDQSGLLRYYDDYNDPDGPGYHNEEWYVPARFLSSDQTYWSRSYMDPYSYQPMVTVTAPMFDDKGEFYGVSTVDLKLEGLNAFLKNIAASFGGYAFAVDRNGKFLSFPDEQMTKVYEVDHQGNRTEEFIYISELADKQPAFVQLSDAVNRAIQQGVVKSRKAQIFNQELANRIDSNSYQIDRYEAELISAMLSDMNSSRPRSSTIYHELFIDNDAILGEPAFAAVFDMPKTYWKVVIVMPYSRAVYTADTIYNNLASTTGAVMVAATLFMLLLVRHTLVRPVANMSTQLRTLANSPDAADHRIEINDNNELGELAYWFNKRSESLLNVQHDLQAMHEELENRIADRTEELRVEISRRIEHEKEQEQRAMRIESQHAALVSLTHHKALLRGDIEGFSRALTEIAANIASVDRVGIWLIRNNELECVDLYDLASKEHRNDIVLPLNEFPVFSGALSTNRTISVYDIHEDHRTREFTPYARMFNLASLSSSVILLGGEMKGVVTLETIGERKDWHYDETRFCGELADQCAQVLTNEERLNSETRIRQLAFYDPLTNLANRRLIHETIQHALDVAIRQSTYGCVIYMDLDNFKTLNDSLGHHVGDELLIQFAERLRDTLRKEDMVSRMGGDEFVILMDAENNNRDGALQQARSVTSKIQSIIGTPFELHGFEHVVTASIGVTIYPEQGDSARDLLQQADAAMYRAKSKGRNTVCYYDPEMQKTAERRLLLEKELRLATSRGEFELFLQPQMDYEGLPHSAEALIRWHHQKHGLVSPADFIPVAEETGLILEIGEWALEQVCHMINHSNLEHIAANISPQQFRQANFVDIVSNIIRKTSIDPNRLMLELTEGIVIENVNDTITKMKALKETGIRFSIDDFGTGYSSLSYLKQMPIDELKIDAEFVRDIHTDKNDAVIVETIISMARHLGLGVIAEGVETRDQLDFLYQKGCDLFQGYYFSKAMPHADFLEYLRKYNIRLVR